MENIKELEECAMKVISGQTNKKELTEAFPIDATQNPIDDQDSNDMNRMREDMLESDEPTYSVTDFTNFVQKYDDGQYEASEDNPSQADDYQNEFQDAVFIKTGDDADRKGNVLLKVVDDNNIDSDYLGRTFSVPANAVIDVEERIPDTRNEGEPDDEVAAAMSDIEFEDKQKRLSGISDESEESPKEELDNMQIVKNSLSLGDISNLVFENRTITEGCSKKNKNNKKPPFFGKKSDSKSDDDSKKGKSKKGKRPFWLKKKGKSNEEKLEEARQYGFSK